MAAKVAVQRSLARNHARKRDGMSLNTERLGSVKHRARVALNGAVYRGDIVRKSCEACGADAEKSHGHHTDYSKPLDVQWLCPKHHGEAHRGKKGYSQRETVRRGIQRWMNRWQNAAWHHYQPNQPNEMLWYREVDGLR